MQVGQECSFPVEVYKDELTGRQVRRIGSPEYRTHHQYFYLRMWTGDSRQVLISSSREDGIYRHYLVDVETGEAVCLSDCRNLSAFFGELSIDERHLLYVAGPELRMRDLSALTEQTVYTQPEPWAGAVYYGATADHSRVVMMEMHKDDRIEAKEGWDAFEKQFSVHPRCRLVELDIETGDNRVIHEDRCWLGHPNYRPDGRTIMFCHEGPWQLVDSRIWFIEPDGSNLREGRKRDPSRPAGRGTGELWGHEYWLADSSHAAFVYYPKKAGQDATVRLLDPDTMKEEILMKVSGFCHFISNTDNSLIVGDGSAEMSDAIHLVDVAGCSESVLCRHGSSWKPYIDPRTGRPSTQEVHPHPCFNPDSRRVVFSGDRHGFPSVYVAEI
ncbi:MAG: oligogalacturonate lyase family protein [Planctomycetota bacterium]|nr:oligogalacturonate lyase family protein [Planctomycetota bacterium]